MKHVMTRGRHTLAEDERIWRCISEARRRSGIEQRYDSEAILQQLVADHPQLLVGSDIDPDDPRRFMLVRREAPVANVSLDDLFVDQDAIPRS